MFIFFRVTTNEVVEMVGHLGKVRDHCQHLQEERRIIMAHLGMHGTDHDDADVLPTFR